MKLNDKKKSTLRIFASHTEIRPEEVDRKRPQLWNVENGSMNTILQRPMDLNSMAFMLNTASDTFDIAG